MKKVVFGIIIVSMLFTCGFALLSCEISNDPLPTELDIIESGDFVYYMGEESCNGLEGNEIILSGAIIVGLSKIGKEKATVIIPVTIDGLPVIKVGYELGLTNYRIPTGNTVKIFIPWEIPIVAEWCLRPDSNDNGYKLIVCGKQTKIIFSSKTTYVVSIDETSKATLQLLYDDAVRTGDTEIIQSYEELLAMCQAQLNNIRYHFNYINAPNDGVYWADHLEINEQIFSPPMPSRQDYVFDGWFQDIECNIEFNFNQIFNDSVIDLYAKWI